jgi:hypothetical protein
MAGRRHREAGEAGRRYEPEEEQERLRGDT